MEEAEKGSVDAVVAEFKRRAEAGDGTAACSLGDWYRTGDGVPQDSAASFLWYSRGAELGDRNAQNNLGTVFLNAMGVERAPEKAVYWYRKSAEQGLAIAQYNLAIRYLEGDGVGQDYTEAREWFTKALLQGDTEAARELGTMWMLGRGSERNLLAAAEFHMIAAEAGDAEACGYLIEYRSGLEAKALSGSQMASLLLSKIYNRGFGVPASQSMTWAWILCAKKYCPRETDAEITQEVDDVYDCFRVAISAENRRLGRKALADMRKAKSGKRTR